MNKRRFTSVLLVAVLTVSLIPALANGKELWKCTIDLHQGDTGSLEFSREKGQIEGKIIDNIRAFLPQSTLVVISHRFSTIKKMDLVYFLIGAKKIEVGTSEALLNRDIGYRNYLAHQLEEEKALTHPAV